MLPLVGPDLKLSRAEEHLNTFKKAVESFKTTEPKPYSFVIKPDIQPSDYLLVANISHGPPQHWSAIIGDFAHNCRSALDLLVYQVSILAPNDDARFSLQFPIFDLPNGNPKSAIPRERSGYFDAENRYLRGVPQKYRTVIEGFQPYKGGNSFSDPLGPSPTLTTLINTESFTSLALLLNMPARRLVLDESEVISSLEPGLVSELSELGTP